jgi:hypothetical protein
VIDSEKRKKKRKVRDKRDSLEWITGQSACRLTHLLRDLKTCVVNQNKQAVKCKYEKEETKSLDDLIKQQSYESEGPEQARRDHCWK